MMTTPSQSTTGTLKRDVSDTIRHLWPETPILALVSSGLVKGSDIAQEKGLIRKRRVESRKYEAFTYSPLAVEFTAASASSGSPISFTVSSGDGLTLKMCLVNTANWTVCRIGSITTSTTLAVTTIGGTAFSCAAGDTLLAIGPAYEEGSSDPYVLQKDEDNLYNLTQIFRFPVSIARTAQGAPHYGGNFWKRLKARNIPEGLRKCEMAMLFSQRPSSTNETTTDAVLADAFHTMRGLYNWKYASIEGGGSMSHDWFTNEMPLQLHETVGSNTKLIALCGNKTFAQMMSWVNDKLQVYQEGERLKRFGMKSYLFTTCKGDIEVVLHDAFNRGEAARSMLIFDPEKYDYVHLRDDDFKANNNIQSPSTDGTMDEILGEVSICPNDAGYSTAWIKNTCAA
jgi:hypothetical protein